MADFSVARFVVGVFELICGLAVLGSIGLSIWAVTQEEWDAFLFGLVGFVASLLIMAICQLVKAQIVTADASQKMLAIMQKQQNSKQR